MSVIEENSLSDFENIFNGASVDGISMDDFLSKVTNPLQRVQIVKKCCKDIQSDLFANFDIL